MFGVSKDDYEKALRANKELRVRMEKLRLENTLLKDQIRALKSLPPEEGEVYVFVQTKDSVTLDDLMKKFESKDKKDIIKILESLLQKKYLDVIEKDGVDYYSVSTADPSGGFLKAKI
jgi:hypothetical protein